MRLNDQKKSAIKSSIKNLLPDAEVFLFGSRVDDSKKGGDIDLLINLTQKPDRSLKSKIKYQIWEKIGEQKIDIVFDFPGSENEFVDLIKLEAEKL